MKYEGSSQLPRQREAILQYASYVARGREREGRRGGGKLY